MTRHYSISLSDSVIKLIVVLVIFGLSLGISYLCVSHRQNQMDGGLVVDKYMVESHYVHRLYYDSTTKSSRIRTIFVPTSYTLAVEKELKGTIRVKEVSVSAEKFYSTNVGEIYYKN